MYLSPRGRTFAMVVLMSQAAALPQSIERSVVERVKGAVVYIEQKRSIPIAKREFSFSASGFFVSSSGHVVTNYHVVQEVVAAGSMSFPASIIDMRLILNSGSPQYRILRGRVIAVDKENDLAVLETDTTQVPFLSLGNESNLAETTPVWAFGYPLGEAFALIQRGPEISVTRGTISALRHNDRGVLTSVQIDAAINPGNSGGPLVDPKGNVVGVINRSGGTTGLNFAVPSHFLSTLLQNLPSRTQSGDSCTIDLVSIPPKASVFIDHQYKGETPCFKMKLLRTMHSLLIMRDGYESWMERIVIADDRKFNITLKPAAPLSLRIDSDSLTKGKCEGDPRLPPAAERTILYRCIFNDTAEFAEWRQETGGSSTRTWFLEKGLLHQYESNELLHAIYLGDSTWKDYSLSAKVRINDSHHDSRAGLIFRETADGFYLFRIHRESNKAHLAYHSRHPFGWFVLAQKKIGPSIGDAWHTMTVSVYDGAIACYLDSSCIFQTTAAYSDRGRIGFYSVESKASFDSCIVWQAPAPASIASPLMPQSLISFWFIDMFDLHSTWWRQCSPGTTSPCTWQFGEGGCVQLRQEGKTTISECMRFRLSDFSLDLAISTGDSGNNARIGILFRKNGNDYCSVEFSKKDSKIRLLQEIKGKQKTLKQEKMDESVFGVASHVELLVDGAVVKCSVNDAPILTCKKGTLQVREGTLGFMMTDVSVVFHKMTVSSSIKNQ